MALADPEGGGTEAECDSALAAARRLMVRYDVEMFEVTTEEERLADVTHDVLWTHGRSAAWRGMLLNHLAGPLGCSVVRTRFSPTQMRWTVVGTPVNIAFIRELHASLVPWLEGHALRARRSQRPDEPDRFMAAFYNQAMAVIAARLKLQKEYLEIGEQAIHTAIATERKRANDAYVEQLFGQINPFGVPVQPPPTPPLSDQLGAMTGARVGAAAILSRGELPKSLDHLLW